MNELERDTIQSAVARIVGELGDLVMPTVRLVTILHELTRINLVTYGRTADAGEIDLVLAVQAALRDPLDERF